MGTRDELLEAVAARYRAATRTETLTDVATGWTECAPLLFREQRLLGEVMTALQAALPFPLLGFDTDNDTVFMNEPSRPGARLRLWSSPARAPTLADERRRLEATQVLRAKLGGLARWMKRIAQAKQADDLTGSIQVIRDHRGDSPAHRLAAND